MDFPYKFTNPTTVENLTRLIFAVLQTSRMTWDDSVTVEVNGKWSISVSRRNILRST